MALMFIDLLIFHFHYMILIFMSDTELYIVNETITNHFYKYLKTKPKHLVNKNKSVKCKMIRFLSRPFVKCKQVQKKYNKRLFHTVFDVVQTNSAQQANDITICYRFMTIVHSVQLRQHERLFYSFFLVHFWQLKRPPTNTNETSLTQPNKQSEFVVPNRTFFMIQFYGIEHFSI